VGLIAVAILMYTDYRRLASPLVVFPALALEIILLVARTVCGPQPQHASMVSRGDGELSAVRAGQDCSDPLPGVFPRLRKGEVNDWKHTLAPITLVAGIMALLVLREP
jgi:hypothetical protein